MLLGVTLDAARFESVGAHGVDRQRRRRHVSLTFCTAISESRMSGTDLNSEILCL